MPKRTIGKSAPAAKAPTARKRRSKAPAIRPHVSKIDALIDLMRKPGGASITTLQSATGWQAHSVRGAIAGAVKKVRGHTVLSLREGGVRTYRIDA